MPRRPPMASRSLTPSAPRRRSPAAAPDLIQRLARVRGTSPGSTLASEIEASPSRWMASHGLHPLSDARANARLQAYDTRVKQAFDRIVPVLKQLSALQHDDDFVERAQQVALAELGYTLPLPILERAWVTQLDMRTLFAWCLFETYEQISATFFQQDPLEGQRDSAAAKEFEAFLLGCGFHLLDITPCADGRLAHAIAFALRLPYSAVRRRPHAGALFDVENTVNRWEIGRAHV